jgi:hypothetical protein
MATSRTTWLFLSCVALAATGMRADEGMWTFEQPPIATVRQKYGFEMTPAWLDHLRLASVRLNDGGSGSFVSPDGLVLTNHHVALGQLQKLSSAETNYAANGFYARTRAQEIKATDLEINVLISSEDVTPQIVAAARGAATPRAALEARDTAIARIEKESLDRTGLRSDVVPLYQGAQYWLYRYKRYTDVRVVFAPEQQMAFFGGDPDNFTYPRYDLDFALFRVYENNAPIHSEQYLPWHRQGAAEHELVFVAGHPGATDRTDTVAELETARDVELPATIGVLTRRLNVLRQFATRGSEAARQASELTFDLENALKASAGEYEELRDPALTAKKLMDERALRQKVEARADWRAAYANAWDAIARAEATKRKLYDTQRFGQLRGSSLAGLGLAIVQHAAELKKPDGERLPGFHTAQLPSTERELLSPAPVDLPLQQALLADALQESLEKLGPSHPFIKAALAGRSPEKAAASLIGGTTLADPNVRKRLVEGRDTAVAGSTDPLIVLGRALAPLASAVRETMQREVTSIETAAHEKIGQARFAVYGTTVYPDATFTLRLSFGVVSGYPMNGTKAPYKTTFAGLLDRSASFDGAPPFALSSRFTAARDRITWTTPLNFVTTNDIIGGNSGSPVVNRDGEIVGLIFDGNIESLAGRYVYDERKNRAVAVHAAAIEEALRVIYDAAPLADEIDPPRGRSGAAAPASR